MPESGAQGDGNSLLLTDYHQLAMVQAYVEHGLSDVASFELFVRALPAGRTS